MLKWCKHFVLFCFLQHFALNLWCSGYSSLSLCRCVFTGGNSTLPPLLVQKPVFLTVFLQSGGVSGAHTCSHASYSLLLRSGQGEAAVCVQLLPVQIQQIPPQKLFWQLEEMYRAVRLSAAPLASPAIFAPPCLTVLRSQSLTIQVHMSETSNQNIIGNLA